LELFQLETGGPDKEVRFAVKIVEHDKTGDFGSDVWIVQVGIGIDLGAIMEKVKSKLDSAEGSDWMGAASVKLLIYPTEVIDF
jgi:hypothetical protein